MKLLNLPKIDNFKLLILFTKSFEKVVHRPAHSSVDKVLSEEFECNMFLTDCHRCFESVELASWSHMKSLRDSFIRRLAVRQDLW